MRKFKLHKISYKRVGFPTFLYDKKLQFYIDICTRRIISKKSSVSYTLYLHIYFLSNPLHASIEKDIAPVCYENNETKVIWKFRLLPQFLKLVPSYIDSLQILYMWHSIFAIVFFRQSKKRRAIRSSYLTILLSIPAAL